MNALQNRAKTAAKINGQKAPLRHELMHYPPGLTTPGRFSFSFPL